MTHIAGADVYTYTPDDDRSFVFTDMYYIRNKDALAERSYQAGKPHAVIEDGKLNDDGNVEVYNDPLGSICITPAGAIIEPERFLCVGWVEKSSYSGNKHFALVMGTDEALRGIGAVGIEQLREAV